MVIPRHPANAYSRRPASRWLSDISILRLIGVLNGNCAGGNGWLGVLLRFMPFSVAGGVGERVVEELEDSDQDLLTQRLTEQEVAVGLLGHGRHSTRVNSKRST